MPENKRKRSNAEEAAMWKTRGEVGRAKAKVQSTERCIQTARAGDFCPGRGKSGYKAEK